MDVETVVRLRALATRTDRYSGETVPDWESDLDELPIETLAPAAPTGSSEPAGAARDAVVSGWVLYLPEDADVTSVDRVRVRGLTYMVTGKPAAWAGAGLVVTCEIVEG